jgi:dTDP-4-dehydrorhamnose 3,5-epimerase-like enzyme
MNPLMKNMLSDYQKTEAWQEEKIPFAVKRVYWISNVPSGTIRGTHAHRDCEEIVYVLNGQVQVKLVDLKGDIEFMTLNKNEKLYIPVHVWKEITFYNEAILIVYASTEYDENDYIYEEEFFGKK